MARAALNRRAMDEISELALGKKTSGHATAKRFSYRPPKRARAKAPRQKKKIAGQKPAAKKFVPKPKKAKPKIAKFPKKKPPIEKFPKISLPKESKMKESKRGESKISIHIRRLEEIEKTIQRLVGKRKPALEPKSKSTPKPKPPSKAEKAKEHATSIAARAVRARTTRAQIDPSSAEELSRNVFSMVQRTKILAGKPAPFAEQQKKFPSSMPAVPQMFPPQIVPSPPQPMPALQQPLPSILQPTQRRAFPSTPISASKRIPNFLPALDNAFQGGFNANSLIVIDSIYQAEAKLLMIYLASLALKNNEPVLYISLDDSAEGIASKAKRSGLEFSSYYGKGLLYFIDGFSRFYGQYPESTEQITRIAGPTALTEMSSATMKAISNFFLFGRYYKVAQAISGISDSENEIKGIQAYPKVFLDSVSTLFYFFQPPAVQRFLLSEKSKLDATNATLFTVHNSRLFSKEVNETLRQNSEYYLTLEYENENLLLRIESSATPIFSREILLRLTQNGFEQA